MNNQGSAPREKFALDPPTDCSLYALRPAPVGRWIAVEWECSFGPMVEMFDSASGESHFILSDPTIDSRVMGWLPDGRWLFVKIGTLSVPQILRVNAATGSAIELPLSPFTYDLTSSPDGKKTLFSLSRGVGLGSETWLAGPDGQNPSQLLVDAQNIITLAQYSPDGSQIAFIKLSESQSGASGELWVMDSAGFNARKLMMANTEKGIWPAWSPDGGRIAFAGWSADQPTANLSIYDLRRDELISYQAAPITQPVWSPDGARIAFSIGSGKANEAGSFREIWFYDISSQQATKVFTGACCAGWVR
jgi:Tol biopolymer transport system component